MSWPLSLERETFPLLTSSFLMEDTINLYYKFRRANRFYNLKEKDNVVSSSHYKKGRA